MAKIPGDPRIDQYTASEGQTVFIYDFKIYSDEEIKVLKNAEELTLTTDYTVQDAGEEEGGTITLVVGATAGDVYTLIGDTYIQRETQFTPGGRFAAADLNNELDKLDNLDSENATETQANFHLPFPVPGVSLNIPLPEAGKSLKWNAEETEFILTQYDLDTIAQTAITAAAEAAASAVLAAEKAVLAGDKATEAANSATAAATSATEAAASAASINLPELESHIIPAVTNFYNLGTPSFKWNNIRSKNLYASSDGSANFLGSINLSGSVTSHITPSGLSRDLGSGSAVWRAGYVKNMYAAVTYPRCIYEGHVGDVYATADVWQRRILDTAVVTEIPGAVLNTTDHYFTLPLGRYKIRARMMVRHTSDSAYTKSVLAINGGPTTKGADQVKSLGGEVALSYGFKAINGRSSVAEGEFVVTSATTEYALYTIISVGGGDFGATLQAGIFTRLEIKQITNNAP